MTPLKLEDFLRKQMRQSGRFIAARLQAALALLERLRERPVLRLDAHKKANSSGLDSHEKYGACAHQRLQLEALNKNHGRRSSNIGGWGQELLDRLKDAGFESASLSEKTQCINSVQDQFAAILRGILEQEPLNVQIKGRSAETVIHEILKQAAGKGKAGEVAQYLVGAKLKLRFKRQFPIVPANKSDRKSHSDLMTRTGDFEIENAAIEVAVGLPDDKHLSQIAETLEDNDREVWLLASHDRVMAWKNKLADMKGVDMRRVVVTSVESFVGQNISELGEFSSRGKAMQLVELFKIYNEIWVANVGTPGIRINVK